MNIQKAVAYTQAINRRPTGRKKRILFVIATKKVKCTGINLT